MKSTPITNHQTNEMTRKLILKLNLLKRAICVDPANFWPKPKAQTQKLFRWNLVTVVVGLPVFGATWMQLLQWVIFCDGVSRLLGVCCMVTPINTLAVPSSPSAVPYAMSSHQRSPVPLVDLTVRLGHAAAVAVVLPAILQLELALLLLSLPLDQLRLVNHTQQSSL